MDIQEITDKELVLIRFSKDVLAELLQGVFMVGVDIGMCQQALLLSLLARVGRVMIRKIHDV